MTHALRGCHSAAKKKSGPKVRTSPLPPPPAILPLSGHVLVCPQNHAKQKNSILKRILELCPDMYKLVTIFFPFSCWWACSIKGPDGKTAGQLAEAIAASAVANCHCPFLTEEEASYALKYLNRQTCMTQNGGRALAEAVAAAAVAKSCL